MDKFTRAIVMVREVQSLSQNAHTRMLIDESSPSIAPACLRTVWHHAAELRAVQASHTLYLSDSCELHVWTNSPVPSLDKFTRAIVMAREVQSLNQNAHTHMLMNESSPSAAPVCLRATWHHTAELIRVQASRALLSDSRELQARVDKFTSCHPIVMA